MQDLVLLGTGIFVAGLLVVFLAILLASRSKERESGGDVQVRGGGVVMVGPIPIIFGTDPKWAVIAILLAIVLVVLAFALTKS
jgi:uncharacterized protein (TIGR00304 family)